MTSIAVTASTATKLGSSRVKIDDSKSASLGRRLTVTQSTPAGALLVCLDPLISVLDNTLLDKACSTCFSPSKTVDEKVGKELLKCTGCGILRYCSKVPTLQLFAH
jgi:hypothetical protein